MIENENLKESNSSKIRRFGLIAAILVSLTVVFSVGKMYFTSWAGVAGASLSAKIRLVRTRDMHCSVLDAIRPASHEAFRDQLLTQVAVLQTDGAGFEFLSSPLGSYWTPANNRAAFTLMIAEERHTVGNKSEDPMPGDVVLDCGANVGIFTRRALRQGARLVVAIEPASENLECLRRNFSAEIAQKRVVIYPKGVWNKDATMRLNTVAADSSVDSVVFLPPGSRPGPEVQLTTIDHLASELKLDSIDFIRMDIQGAEAEALQGGEATIARFRPRMSIALEHRLEDVTRLPALVNRLWPGLKTACGPCVLLGNRVQPDALYVHR